MSEQKKKKNGLTKFDELIILDCTHPMDSKNMVYMVGGALSGAAFWPASPNQLLRAVVFSGMPRATVCSTNLKKSKKFGKI
jgi:hypothetical protein